MYDEEIISVIKGHGKLVFGSASTHGHIAAKCFSTIYPCLGFIYLYNYVSAIINAAPGYEVLGEVRTQLSPEQALVYSPKDPEYLSSGEIPTPPSNPMKSNQIKDDDAFQNNLNLIEM